MSRRQSSQPNSPTTPTHQQQQHAYESFADLVPNSTPPTSPLGGSPRRGHFFGVGVGGGGAGRASPVQPSSAGRRWPSVTLPSASPSSQHSHERRPSAYADTDAEDEEEARRLVQAGQVKPDLTTWDMILLTIGLAGAQGCWCVEMSFGTPYLLSLGMNKQSTALVWLAGPLSGLIVQPVVGALSDSSPSPYRRRQYILLSTLLIVTSTLLVAFAQALARLVAGLSGLGDWDPKMEERVQGWAVGIGVGGFWVLDFGLNGLQAALRALILDRTPPHQQPQSNAWHGRQTHLGNILGYLCGYLNLGRSPLLSWLGGGQFRKLAVVACAVMCVTTGVVCATQGEEARRGGQQEEQGVGRRLKGVVRGVRESLRDLPLPVRRVCYVQFFSWTSWFPVLFYSTTYITEILYTSLPSSSPPPTPDEATRLGSLALLLYAIVALVSGSVLPLLSTLGRRKWVDRCVSRRSRTGRVVRRALVGCSLRNFWTAALGWFAMVMVATFWVRSVRGAMWVVAALGVPWSVTCWVPFALVMESIRTLQDSHTHTSTSSYTTPSSTPQRQKDYTTLPRRPLLPPQPFRATSSSNTSALPSPTSGRAQARQALTECDPLLPSSTRSTSSPYAERPAPNEAAEAGGTILGIHNLSIVAPQFLVALISAGIFSLLSLSRSAPSSTPGEGAAPTNDVVWVLRFGGLAALLGCVVSRWVLETDSERDYREWVLRGPDEDEEGDSEEGAEGL